MKSLLQTFLRLVSAPARCFVTALEKYDMEMNKIAGSVFLAGIIAMVSGLLASGLYPGGEPHGPVDAEVKRGYVVPGAEQFAEGASGGPAGAAADAGPVDIATFLATADVAAGEKLIKRCTACHTFDKGGKHGVGPNNYGIVGAQVAHAAGFAYSDAMKSKGGTWTFQTLSEFLANPKTYIPGNKMAFAGIRNPQERAHLLAYLNTLSDSPQAMPKPAAPAEKPVEGKEKLNEPDDTSKPKQ